MSKLARKNTKKEVLSGLLEEPLKPALPGIRHEKNLRNHLILCMRLADGHLRGLPAYWDGSII